MSDLLPQADTSRIMAEEDLETLQHEKKGSASLNLLGGMKKGWRKRVHT